MSYSSRISILKNSLTSDAVLISDQIDIFYLTGFLCLTPEEREAYVFVTSESAHLFLSSFSAPVQVQGLEVEVGGIERILKEKLPLLCQVESLKSITIDGNSLKYNEFKLLQSILPEISFHSSTDNPLSKQKMIKDDEEISLISQANHVTHQALNLTLDRLEVGMSELDVQEIFENQVRRLGTKHFAFPTIVAFGPHTALPHHQPFDSAQGKPGPHILEKNTAVLIDCGAKWQGYCADVTRTIWFGDTPDEEFIRIESVVKEAYDKTVGQLVDSSVRRFQPEADEPLAQTNQHVTDLTDITDLTELTASHLDKTARDFITERGYGPQFIHTTGHGVGLYIHEQPSLSQRNVTPIVPNMIITIEPGIYLPDRFGYRFENSILITQDGYQELL